jgi:hypothetical protein
MSNWSTQSLSTLRHLIKAIAAKTGTSGKDTNQVFTTFMLFPKASADFHDVLLQLSWPFRLYVDHPKTSHHPSLTTIAA